MGPLRFVDWHAVNTYFCVAMWLLVAVLAIVIVGHVVHAGVVVGHVAASLVAR
jgi:hypothetical protein